MIKVYTLFFLLILSIVAKSEALASGDSIVNPLDTIEVTLVKEGILLPQQVYAFVQNLENFYNDVEGSNALINYTLTDEEALIFLDGLTGDITNAGVKTREEAALKLSETSNKVYDILIKQNGNVNQVHVYNYKSNKLQSSASIPDRNILYIALLKNNEYVLSYEVFLLLINGQLKLFNVL